MNTNHETLPVAEILVNGKKGNSTEKTRTKSI